MYEDGEGADADFQKAKQLYSKSCDLKNGNACANLGFLYENHEELSAGKPKIFELYQKGCSLDSSLACNNLAAAYQDALGVKQDYKQAIIYYQKSCDMGYYDACSGLGYLYDEGLGTDKDLTKASSLYQKACDNKSGSGCYNYGLVLMDDEKANGDEITSTFNKSCEYLYYDACTVLGEIYRDGKNNVKKDDNKSIEAFNVACLNSQSYACVQQGDLYLLDKKTYEEGVATYVIACDLGDAVACAKVAWFYSDGKYTTKDIDMAKVYVDAALAIDDEEPLAKSWVTKFGK